MKFRRLLMLTLVFSLLCTVSAFADDVYDYVKAKKITVVVNDTELKSPGFIVESRGVESKGVDSKGAELKTMLPLRDMSTALQAMVDWDESTQTVTIYKPNVHLFLFNVIKDKISTKPFGNVSKGGQYDFVVFSQVDNLLTNVSSLKVTVEDPNGKEVQNYDAGLKDVKDNFWYTTPTFSQQFKYQGKYIVKFYLKLNDESDYQLVSQKVIVSLPE